MTKHNQELKARAEELRRLGWSVPQIAVELRIARSTAFVWTKHLPLDGNTEAALRRKAHSKAMTDARWAEHRVERAAERAAIHEAAAADVGSVSERELLLVGAAIYWAEGSKNKPWRPYDWRVSFTNSDLGLIRLFLRFLHAAGVSDQEVIYRLSIHESADVEAARRWWIGQLGLTEEELTQLVLKRHNPISVRYNAGDEYRGCLVVYVRRATRLYWRIEGIMNGLLGGG